MAKRWRCAWAGALALVASTAGPASAFTIPVPYDKAAHFGLSYVLTDQLMRAGVSPDEALAWTLAIGWAKEMTDAEPDPGDMAADAGGALLARYVRLQWRF